MIAHRLNALGEFTGHSRGRWKPGGVSRVPDEEREESGVTKVSKVHKAEQ